MPLAPARAIADTSPMLEPLPIPNPPGAAALRRALLAWYDRHRRSLPWRDRPEPYRVLVSEFMLQQTQVATVLPYFERFLSRFPTLSHLAEAPEDEVRAAWSGLGYYRRARNLQAAARAVVSEHGGRLPADLGSLRALPGVGDYTAAALGSIVHGIPRAVLDGNVIRVLARLIALEPSTDRAPVRRALWDLADRLLEPARPGDWNQAMMELGATVCLPHAPRCGECPWRETCRARAVGEPEGWPRRDKARETVAVERALAVIRHHGRVLLVLRRDPRLLDGTWEFPGVDVPPGDDPREALSGHLVSVLAHGFSVEGELARARHSITYRRITVRAFAVRARRPPRAAGGQRTWVDGASVGSYPISSMTAKILSAVERLTGS